MSSSSRCVGGVLLLLRRGLSSSSKGGGGPYRQAPSQIEAKWSEMMRANPFALFGSVIGIEPTDKLPSMFDFFSALMGEKSQLVNFGRDMNEKVDQYCEDVGLARTSLWAYEPRELEQDMDSFLDGASTARDVVVKWSRGESEEWFDPSSCLSPLLTKENAKPLSFNDFVPKTTTFGGKLAEYITAYPPFRIVLDKNVVHLVDHRGFFSARFELDSHAANIVKAVDGDPNLFEAAMYKRGVTWPLEPQAFLNKPSAGGEPKSYHGFFVVDVEFDRAHTDDEHDEDDLLEEEEPSTTWTFARQCDHRRDARWSHDWKVVDIDGVLTRGGDWDYSLHDILLPPPPPQTTTTQSSS